MKKVSKLMAMLLVLAMTLSLCGCGDLAKKLYGTWGMKYDMADMIAQEMGEDFADFESSLKMTLLFDFNEDGTFKMYVKEEEFVESLDGWQKDFITYSMDVMYDMFAEQGVEKEEADSLIESQYGYTMEEYMLELLATAIDGEAMVAEMETNGTFELKGDKLYMAEEGQEMDISKWDVITIEGDTLTMNAPEGVEEEELLPGLEYPFVLTREK